MKRTTDITIYHLNGTVFDREVYRNCFWEDDQAGSTRNTGIKDSDRLYISIPLSDAPDLKINKNKDYVVKGVCEYELVTGSTSLKGLQAITDVFTLTTIALKDHGSPRMHHWELGGK